MSPAGLLPAERLHVVPGVGHPRRHQVAHVDAPVVPRPDVAGEPDGLGVVHVLADGVAFGSDGVDEEEIDIGIKPAFKLVFVPETVYPETSKWTIVDAAGGACNSVEVHPASSESDG